MKKTNLPFVAAFIGAVASSGAIAAEPGASSRIALNRDDEKGQLKVSIDGSEAFVFCYGADQDLAHFYPVRSPAGQSMTVQHPTPYPHHRSFWFADKVRLGDRRAAEFYGALYSSESGRGDPKPPFRDHVRMVEFSGEKLTKDQAELGIKLLWEMDDDVPVLDESRTLRIVALGDGEYLLDVTFTLTASHGDVAFVSDAVHYAWPYIRMNSEFSVDGGGTITNSEGGVNQKGTHNMIARWVDYSNTVDEKTSGLAIFSHADNAQPHKWLTRDYGCFGPRRIDQRSGKPFTLKQGESISRRVGVLVHRGDVNGGKVAARYRQYIDGEL